MSKIQQIFVIILSMAFQDDLFKINVLDIGRGLKFREVKF